MDLKGIIITGASNGIGAALASQLSMPHRVLGLVGRNAQRLAAVAEVCTDAGARCQTATIDIRDTDKVTAFVHEFDRQQPIDLLIANAGILDGRHVGDTVETRGTARIVFETNLLATIDTVHAALPAMRHRRRGGIILVSSLAGLVPLADAPAYSASKAGLLFYGLALREAVANEGIKVTVACPGFVSTAMAKIHAGLRPGELSQDEAAIRILEGFHRDRAINGFPLLPFWLSRLSLLMPEFVRRHISSRTRFHVVSPQPGEDIA